MASFVTPPNPVRRNAQPPDKSVGDANYAALVSLFDRNIITQEQLLSKLFPDPVKTEVPTVVAGTSASS